MQGRYDSEIHEGRFYVSQPSLRSWPRKTTASVYFREDLNPPTEQTDPFDISRQGASIQQEVQFRKIYVWSYGYRYELANDARAVAWRRRDGNRQGHAADDDAHPRDARRSARRIQGHVLSRRPSRTRRAGSAPTDRT